MSGARDPLYVLARRTLLDALEALELHLDAIVLVGAQAVYAHTGEAEFAVAEYTTDADLAVRPGDLADTPLLADALVSHGFTHRDQPGSWLSPDGVCVDLMVPEVLAGPGRRGARLGVHGNLVARRAKGLEGALIDRDRHAITAFDPLDRRSVTMWIAGPGALVVAKLHKIAERVEAQDRVRDKDALDVLRLLRAVATRDLAERLRRLLASDLASIATQEALGHLRDLFLTEKHAGAAMAARAAGGGEDSLTIAMSAAFLARDLLAAVERPDR